MMGSVVVVILTEGYDYGTCIKFGIRSASRRGVAVVNRIGKGGASRRVSGGGE